MRTIIEPTRLRSRRLVAVATITVGSAVLLAATAQASTVPPADGTAVTDAPADSAGATDGAALLPPAEGVTEYPLTITSALGEITIDERPERVVIPDSWDADVIAALGVTPVGSNEQIDFYPWVNERIDRDAVTTWPIGDVELAPEQIATTSPDLIVAGWYDDVENLDQLSSIAPVLGAPVTDGDDPTWRDRLLLLAEALDLSGAAQAFIDEYDSYFADVREQFPEFAGTSLAYLVYWGRDYGTGFLNATGSDGEVVLTQLGFAPSPESDLYVDDDPSAEVMGEFADDVILVVDQSGDDDDYQKFIDAPLLQSTPAAQNGLIVELEFDFEANQVVYDGEPQDFTGHFGRALNVGPLGQMAVAELLVPILAERLA